MKQCAAYFRMESSSKKTLNIRPRVMQRERRGSARENRSRRTRGVLGGLCSSGFSPYLLYTECRGCELRMKPRWTSQTRGRRTGLGFLGTPPTSQSVATSGLVGDIYTLVSSISETRLLTHRRTNAGGEPETRHSLFWRVPQA